MSLGTVFLSEVAGTAILLLFGCGVVANVALDKSKGAGGGFLLVNFGWAIGVFAGVYVAFQSGAHINPAVTVAFTLTRHFPTRDAAAYIVAQLAGATLAALLLHLLWPGSPGDLGATVPSVPVLRALVYEVVLSAFLMFVIMAVATEVRAVGAAAAIAIGGTVGLDAMLGGPVTGRR